MDASFHCMTRESVCVCVREWSRVGRTRQKEG